MRRDTSWQNRKKEKEKGKRKRIKIKQTNHQEDMKKGTQNYLNRNKTIVECKSTRISIQKHNKMF